MITTIRRQYIVFAIILLSFITYSHAQDLRTFNQNSSRSNNTKAFNQNSARSNHARGLSISFSPVYSTAMNTSKDSLLFRGSGAGFRVGADYFFGKAGIGVISGFGSSSPADATINNFLKQFPVPPDQLIITKAKQQNMYLLLGPSVRFGNAVEIYAHAKGGLFINNSGLVSIQQKGAQRAAFRNESTAKSVYPGYITGLGVQYKTKSDVWSFGISMDYMNTQSEVNNYDVRRGGGIEALKLSRNITDVVTGVTVRYNILSPRDHASGQSTGRRLLPTVNKRELTSRDAQSGLSTGRLLPTVNKKEIAIDEPGVQRTSQSCGPVTQKITNPDGTTEEMTFSCPDDAANYASQMKIDGGMPNRISMNVTVPKQTQGATFGEKVNQGLHAAGGALSQGASVCIISGTLTWGSSGERMGIVTNKTVMAGTTSMAGSSARSGSTTMNSQTSSTRQTNQSSFGTMVRLSAREAGSGMATGRRTRDAASGLATGKLYETIFTEGQEGVCNPCLATAKMSDVKNNPLYNDKNMSGVNPLYKGNERTAGSEDEDCDGVAGMDVSLIDILSGSIVARTKTEQCGDFFFANVPEGNYVVKVTGTFAGKKGYDVYLKSKTDLRGGIMHSDDWMQLRINTGSGSSPNATAINNSHSNIKNLILIEADLDGDGEFESTKVLAGLYDGTTKDITAKSRMSTTNSVKKVTVRGWDPKKKEAITGSANAINEYTVSIDNNGVLLTTQHENGTKEEAKVMASVSYHPNVVQFIIPLNPDSDEADNAGRVKTKSNIKNDRVAAGDVNGDGITEVNDRVKTKSNIKNDRVATGDVNGDGLNAGKITKSRSNIQNNRMINDEDGDTNSDNVLVNARAKITKSRSNIQNNRMTNSEEGDDIWSPRSNIKMLRIATGDVDGDGKAELLAGGLVPGGAVISSAMRPGEPIPGIDVKLGKNPGGQALQNTTSNADGEFEFTKLEAGDYFIMVEQKLIIDDETIISVAGGAAENINTSESNLREQSEKRTENTFSANSMILDSKDANIVLNEQDAKSPATFRWTPIVPKPKEPVTYRLKVWQLMQGQNGTQAMRFNRPVVEKSVTGTSETSVQGILTGPCKPPYLCDFIWSVQAFNSEGKAINDNQVQSFSVSSGGGSSTKAQDHNSSRSNKTSSIIANDNDLGDTENPVTKLQNNNVVRSNRKDNALIDNSGNNNSNNIAIDEGGQSKPKGKSNTGPVKWMAPESMKTAINNSHSNIKNLVASLDDLDKQLNADHSNAKSIINTSRSNIKSQRIAISNLEQTIDEMQIKDKDVALDELEQKRNEADLQFLKLRESVKELGPQYTSISNVLKTKHDTVKNSIGNIR